MKEAFRDKRFGTTIKISLSDGRVWESGTWALIGNCEDITQEYMNQGIVLTLRQLYYQLVARGIIPNDDKVYDRLSVLLTDARYNGLIDWDAIEDRVRVPKMHAEWNDVLGLIESAKRSYRLPRWANQDFYIELFTEKDALSSVLEPIADEWHITFCVNRGYSSASAMRDLSKRVISHLRAGKRCLVLYLGDHDPSGLDMLRDIRERINEFLVKGRDYVYPAFEIVPIALTMAQVQQYGPPPNPAKITDPRAKWYIAKYGQKSWEVDALRPEVMIKLVNDTIRKYVDLQKLEAVKRQEREDMKQLEEFAKTLVSSRPASPAITLLFDKDNLRTKVAVMHIINQMRVDEVEKGMEPYFDCPICGSNGSGVDIEDVFVHIFAEHTEAEFREMLDEFRGD